MGVPGSRRARDKDSHRPPTPQAVPAVADQLSAEHESPGAHNPESSVGPPSRKQLTTALLAERAELSLDDAGRLAYIFCRVGLWEPGGVFSDGTPYYHMAETAPTLLLVKWQ